MTTESTKEGSRWRQTRIAVLGLRGFPEVQGGVETHCQELYPRLTELGFEVTVFGRKGYIPSQPYEYKGVKLVPLWAPKQKHLETICHTALGLISVFKRRSEYDLLHIHCIGPALLTPVARWLGLRVVITTHGPDYDRQKWGRLAKTMLRLGERFGAKYAQAVIAVSGHIKKLLYQQYGTVAVYIPNGAEVPQIEPPGSTLSRFDLQAGRYILAVGRLVPEKGFHDLLEAYAGLETDWKLAIVGSADHEDAYSQSLRARAGDIPGVIMTGFQKGRALAELYSNAGILVLPSYHEGLPHVALEAMSYNLPMVVSDIPANMEVALPEEVFPVGDQEALRQKLEEFLKNPDSLSSSQIMETKKRRLREEFNWDVIAKQTAEVYNQTIRVRL